MCERLITLWHHILLQRHYQQAHHAQSIVNPTQTPWALSFCRLHYVCVSLSYGFTVCFAPLCVIDTASAYLWALAAGSPEGSAVLAPAAAPVGSLALQEGSMTFMTGSNSTARSIDPATGLLVSASSLAATQAAGAIYTNQVCITVVGCQQS